MESLFLSLECVKESDMHNIKWIRTHPEVFDAGLERRGQPKKSEYILSLDTRHREIITQLQSLQATRNQLAKQFATAKIHNQDTQPIVQASEELKDREARLEAEAHKLSHEIDECLSSLPNHLADDVPEGKDETSNVLIRDWGTRPRFDFSPKSHFELGQALDMMDFGRAAKLSGSRFVILYGLLSRLERALAAFMLDVNTQEFGYKEVTVPLMVQENIMFGTGQLPKFREDQFQVNTGHWLIPTAEVPLTNLVAQEILDYERLPLRFTAYSPCFRAEAGAAGRDTQGMIRNHQFTKVELVSITTPEQSEEEHDRMTRVAETLLQRLGIPYRVMMLCTGDTGFSARRTYDLEAWLPSQDTYREISSCSHCGDFQARRMNARFRHGGNQEKNKPEFVHTLNGSGLPVGRTLIAILENYQQNDGSIRIPPVLVPYMDGIEIIRKS